MPPWDKYASPSSPPGPWARYAAPTTTPSVPEESLPEAVPEQPQAQPVAPFAQGSAGDVVAQAIPKAVTESLPFRALAGLGGGIVNRATGALQGGADVVSGIAGLLGNEELAQRAGNISENAATVSRGIDKTVSESGTAGKVGQVVGDVGSVVALGPQNLLGGAIAEAATRASGEEQGLGERALNTGINYLGGKILEPIVKPAVKLVGSALGMKGTPNLTSEDLRLAANAAYQRADDVGGTLSPKITNEFLDSASQNLRAQTSAGKLVAGESVSTKLADRLEGLRGKPITLREAQEIDEHLGDVIDGLMDTGRLTKEGKKVLDLQTAFRRTIDKASPDDIVGGKEGFNAIDEGRKLWAKSAQLRDVEKIITRAELTDNPATSIKTGFRTIVSNPARLRGYSPEVQKAMRSAAQTGVIGDTLRVFGSRLIPIASAAMGNVPGAVAGQVGSTLARSGATGLQLQRAQNVANAIAGRGNPGLQMNALPAAAVGAASGLLQSDNTDYGAGNIDLNARPVVRNDDGTISTVRSMSFNEDGQEILIPTVSYDGRIMTDQEAIDTYRRTGKYLGKFNTVNDANNYANSLHQSQNTRYGLQAMPSITQNLISSEEGRRNTVYTDTTGHKTVGVGFNLDQANARKLWSKAGVPEKFDDVYSGKVPLSEDSIDKLYNVTSPSAERAAKKLVPNYDKLGENQKAALTSLVFQLGAEGLSKFNRTLAYLREGNAKAVENNLINSKLGREQAPARTRRTALMLAYDLSHEEADRMLAEQGRIKPNERKYA